MKLDFYGRLLSFGEAGVRSFSRARTAAMFNFIGDAPFNDIPLFSFYYASDCVIDKKYLKKFSDMVI
jgi:hypothetical protein